MGSFLVKASLPRVPLKHDPVMQASSLGILWVERIRIEQPVFDEIASRFPPEEMSAWPRVRRNSGFIG
jgi:hypothetical protein